MMLKNETDLSKNERNGKSQKNDDDELHWDSNVDLTVKKRHLLFWRYPARNKKATIYQEVAICSVSKLLLPSKDSSFSFARCNKQMKQKGTERFGRSCTLVLLGISCRTC